MQPGLFVRSGVLMKMLALSLGVMSLFPVSDAASQERMSTNAIQQEADYRVIAARCGTPAFEKKFSRQSRAAVSAGLVSTTRDAAAVEKSITALRRSPLTLVSASSDCPAQLAQLETVQRQRSGLVKAPGKLPSKP
ncbi:hypothetical protein [Variovorax rhizosphaerae]|uniref:Secreted protein n=1 Tax=Variovorax rhizosphaerae TaxID=1836200 RepID=A0ABU8WWL3_9BURK